MIPKPNSRFKEQFGTESAHPHRADDVANRVIQVSPDIPKFASALTVKPVEEALSNRVHNALLLTCEKVKYEMPLFILLNLEDWNSMDTLVCLNLQNK